MQVISPHLLQPRLRLHKNPIAMELHVTRDLKVIFLLTNKSVVGVGEIEAFVGVDTKMRHCSKRILSNKRKSYSFQLTTLDDCDQAKHAIDVVETR